MGWKSRDTDWSGTDRQGCWVPIAPTADWVVRLSNRPRLFGEADLATSSSEHEVPQ
jgi:hypothetical protein